MTVQRSLLFVLWSMWSVSAIGQPVAEMPDLRVGDQWSYHRTGSEAGRDTDRRWSRRVVEILPDALIRMQRSNGEFDIFDTSWNIRYPLHPEFWPRAFQFPLRVGDEWSFSSPPDSYYLHGSFKVTAYEPISVPAGVFDCFRVEGQTFFSTRSQNDTRHLTRWYCPAVKGIAKAHEEIVIFQSYGLGSHSVTTDELTRFAAGR